MGNGAMVPLGYSMRVVEGKNERDEGELKSTRLGIHSYCFRYLPCWERRLLAKTENCRNWFRDKAEKGESVQSEGLGR